MVLGLAGDLLRPLALQGEIDLDETALGVSITNYLGACTSCAYGLGFICLISDPDRAKVCLEVIPHFTRLL